MSSPPTEQHGLGRHLGLYGATMVGVGAMVGAGIFVLSGVALKAAGPSAILAFLLNGLIVLVTAFSFAELAAAFPESGGSYVFARKVFPIGGAFAAGWVLWFAYVVACALYALGFASFLGYSIELAGGTGPPIVVSATLITCATVGLYIWRGSGAGSWVALAKVIAFVLLILPGLWVLFGSPSGTMEAGLTPAFPFGFSGTLAAMGYTFIALEGFEVIAAVGEEVKDPGRTIPRAMFLSIGITLVIYIALLVVMLVVGGPAEGEAWRDLGDAGEQAVAVAVQRFAGGPGTLIVITAGLLATFTALAATLLAASRVSFSMARDRALPRALGELAGAARSPRTALLVSGGLAVALIVGTGEVEAAGAAASLIFLLSFALVNCAGLLVRVRGGVSGGFQAPLYPFLPLLGASACLALAAFQAAMVPIAAGISAIWLLIGSLAWRLWLRSSAETVSARAEALDSQLVRLRGREPLTLVPLANPARADTLMAFAHAMTTRKVGKVVALAVVRHDPNDPPQAGVAAYDRSHDAMRRAVEAACRLKVPFEADLVVAPDVPAALARTAAARRPEMIVLGMSQLNEPDVKRPSLLERMILVTQADVVVVQAPPAWSLESVKRVLIPIAGGAKQQDPLRARLLGMLQRSCAPELTLLTIVPDPAQVDAAKTSLRRLADDLGAQHCEVEVGDDPVAVLVRRSAEVDLLVLGLRRRGQRTQLLGAFVRSISAGAQCPVVAIAQEGKGLRAGPRRHVP